jgi:hypothetical protein
MPHWRRTSDGLITNEPAPTQAEAPSKVTQKGVQSLLFSILPWAIRVVVVCSGIRDLPVSAYFHFFLMGLEAFLLVLGLWFGVKVLKLDRASVSPLGWWCAVAGVVIAITTLLIALIAIALMLISYSRS